MLGEGDQPEKAESCGPEALYGAPWLQLVATFYVGGLAAAIELALELGEDDRRRG